MRRVKRLRPRPGPWMVRRERLHALLDQSRHFPFTVVSAPAGYGKTSILSDWASTQSQAVSWVSLDASDDSLEQFIGTITGAIAELIPGAGNTTLSMMNTGTAESPETYAAALVDELAEVDRQLVVILDDFHLLTNPDVVTFIQALLRYPSPNLRLIIGSRTTLPFSLASARAHGQVLELGTDDVAFTPDEAASLLRQVVGADDAFHDLTVYIEAADGWAAALHVLALSLQRSPSNRDPNLVVSMATRDSAAFLGSEVFDRLPVALQEYLARIALPDQIAPELVRVLTSDLCTPHSCIPSDLDEVVRMGLFLSPLGLESDWFRFHILFRTILLDRLEAICTPEEISALHKRAAAWYLTRDEVGPAIVHLNRAGDIAAAAELITSHAQNALITDRWIELEGWIASLDPAEHAENLEILVAHAMTLQVRARYDRLPNVVQLIEAQLAKLDPVKDAALLRVYRADLSLVTLWGTTDENVIDRHIVTLRRALDDLDGTGRFSELFSLVSWTGFASIRDPEGVMEILDAIIERSRQNHDSFAELKVGWALCSQAFVCWHAGNTPGMIDYGRQGLAIAQKLHAARLISQCDFFLGIAYYEFNDLTNAERHLRAAATNPSCGGIFLTAAVARLAICLDAVGREAEADKVTDAYLHRLLESQQSDNVFNLRSTMARALYLRARFSEAMATLESIPAAPEQADCRSLEIPWLFKAIILYYRGTPEDIAEADALLDRVETAIGEYRMFRFEVQLAFARALRDQRYGRQVQAAAGLREILAKAERAGYTRTILDLGPPAALLIGLYGHTSPYARGLLDQLSIHAERGRDPSRSWQQTTVVGEPANLPVFVEPLTEREQEILLGLYHRLSNKEIAHDLSISPLTVKTHARNLYSKLGVNSRRQAIVRAMELGMLPRS